MRNYKMAAESEKRNLELHVELGALRDKEINKALENIENKIEKIVRAHQELVDALNHIKEQRNNQLTKWGTAIIATLFSALGMLFLKILTHLLVEHK